MRRVAPLALGLALLTACGGRAEEPFADGGPALAPPAAPAAVDAALAPAVAPPAAELLPNGRLLADGLLVGGQPSLEQLERLRELGYRTVVNLRTEEEPGPAPEEVEALGFSYLRLPVDGAPDVDEEKARTLDVVLGQVEGPVVLHCGSGNRVGALLALRALHVHGASPEEALEIGLAAGLTGLEPEVREQLGLPRE